MADCGENLVVSRCFELEHARAARFPRAAHERERRTACLRLPAQDDVAVTIELCECSGCAALFGARDRVRRNETLEMRREEALRVADHVLLRAPAVGDD